MAGGNPRPPALNDSSELNEYTENESTLYILENTYIYISHISIFQLHAMFLQLSREAIKSGFFYSAV